jgi:hypothetical protein
MEKIMSAPVGRSEYQSVEGLPQKSKKEPSVEDQKISDVAKTLTEEAQVPPRKKLRVSKEPTKQMEQTTEKIGEEHSNILYENSASKFKIVEAPLQEQTPKTEASKQSEIQQELKQNGIPLTCREFTPLTQPNHMQEDEIQKYLQSLPPEYRSTKAKLFQNVQKISYKELQAALFACVQELIQILQDKDYAIGYAENKSQKWVAELALQFMTKTPKESFTTYVDSVFGRSRQSHLTGKADNFVVFDDSSYSGTQLCELLEILIDEIAKQADRPRNICVVVPFMSKPAKEKLIQTCNSLLSERLPGTKLLIITSPIKITSFADKYPPNSAAREELFTCEEVLFEKKLEYLSPTDLRGYLDDSEDNKCLAYMEWKVPDNVSVPRNILFGGPDPSHPFQFLTAFPPPYKAKK